MRFTTEYFESTTNPVHKELYFIITGGHKPGKPIKESEKNGKH